MDVASKPFVAATRRPLETIDGPVTQDALDSVGIKAAIVYDAKALHTDGAHAIYKGVNAQGQTMVVKDNSDLVNLGKNGAGKFIDPVVQHVTDTLFPGGGRLQNIDDVLMRQIFRNNVDCPVIPAQEAVFKDPATGRVHFGIATPFVENMGSIVDENVPALANPAQAARGLVYSSLLMGNWDSTWHEDNNTEISADGRMSNGQAEKKGEYIQSDLGWAGQRGNNVMGIPFGSLELLHSLPPADVQAAVHEVLGLSNQQLHDWVNTAGQETITGWNDKLCSFYSDALAYNRDALARHLAKQPDWLEARPDAFLRGAHEKLGQLALSPFASIRKYVDMDTSGVLRHITTNETMTQQLLGAIKPYPSGQYTISPNS